MDYQIFSTKDITIKTHFLVFIWCLLAFGTGGCTEAIKDWVGQGSGGTGSPPGATSPSVTTELFLWDFSDPLNYTFDTNYLAVANGKLALQQVDQIHSGGDFEGGSHFGTYVDDNGNISLKNKIHSSRDINSILPNKVSNIIGYWKMDGNWDDEGPNGLAAVIQGDPTYSTNSAVGLTAGSFDSVADRMLLPDSNLLDLKAAEDRSFAFWLNINTINLQYIIGKYDFTTGFTIRLLVDNKISVVLEEGGNSASPAFSVPLGVGSWYHIAVIIDRSETSGIKVYINGVASACTSNCGYDLTTIGDMSNALDLGIPGLRGGSASSLLDGLLDEVAIFDTLLSSNEVLSIYATQAQNFTELAPSWTPKWPNIVGYWKMDGNWLDSSGNGANLSVVNEATISANSKIGFGALTLDGTSDFAIIPSSLYPWDGDFSISMWAFTTNSNFAVEQGLMSREVWPANGFRLGLRSGNQISFWTTESGGSISLDSNIVPENNRWYHIILSFDSITSTASLYIDGQFVNSDTGTYIVPAAAGTDLGRAGGWEWVGNIDDTAIWNSQLSSAEVATIYNRQKQKYGGHYDSPIIDVGDTEIWPGLKPVTTLPFYKHLTATSGSESTIDYAALSGDLADGLVGYWPLNGNLGTILDSDSILDLSGNGNSGSVTDPDSTNTISYKKSILAQGIYFDGINDRLSFSSIPGLNDTISISMWMRYNQKVQDDYAESITNASTGPNVGWFIQRANLLSKANIRIDTSGGFNQTQTSNGDVYDGKHHFLTLVLDSGNGKFYIDGTLDKSWVYAHGTGFSSPGAVVVGGLGSYFSGVIGDIAVWNRSLTDIEIEQLYRRGANRIKFQVKSCVDPACICKSLDATGDDNDCDGDGTLNASDASDIHFAQWLGKDGATGTTFSELQNCSIIDTLTGDCDMASMATINATAANFEFNRYPMAAGPINNRYFQYRVLMEAEENVACSGTPCMPQLTSVELGPAERYFGGTYSITSSSSVAYAGLTDISFNTVGSCTLTYQLSPDGINFYYWNGSTWTVASGISQSVSAAAIETNISTFADQVGTGNLYWKAFVNSNTQACELAEIAVRVVQ